jgi:hypothetical protein
MKNLEQLAEEFVSYNQALALNELRYNKLGFRFWTKNNSTRTPELRLVKPIPEDAIPAPLKQQVFKWFRDKYHLHSHIEQYISSEDATEYFYVAGNYQSSTYDTYEETESACIDKLIELIKEKKS